MNEKLFQFIWLHQYFNTNHLISSEGDIVQIVHQGFHNANEGPDFSDARIRIDQTLWVGSVELHLKTSDWNRHGHQHDANYNKVILHVVWENDLPASSVPVLELNGRVSGILLSRYRNLMEDGSFIPCGKQIKDITELGWKSWQERLLIERLSRKSGYVLEQLALSNNHWEEVFWWQLCKNFGAHVNTESFEQIAKSIPLNILARLHSQPEQLEALLMGQAGLLEQDPLDFYMKRAKREHQFLKTKFNLNPVSIPVYFLRMRPVNFPGLRLAQLASLLHSSAHLFSKVLDVKSLNELESFLNVKAGGYWDTHYRYGKISMSKEKWIGRAMIDNIVINTIAPILFAYGNYHKNTIYVDRVISWLEHIAPETNRIVEGFKNIGIPASDAWESQALLELKNSYCDKKRCLECYIGNQLIGEKKVEEI